jgi:ATP-dependent protease HslVU (ClpYQ) peptidase subunit
VTVVAALARDGRVVMAADTATQYANTQVRGARKIRRLKDAGGSEVLLAGSGSGGILAVTAALTIEAMPSGLVAEQIWDEWADRVASAVTSHLAGQTPPLLRTTDDQSQVIDGAYLLAACGRLWYLFTHAAVRVTDGVACLGSGGDYALGALCASGRQFPAETLVSEAVMIACKYDPWCAVDSEGPGRTPFPLVETLG